MDFDVTEWIANCFSLKTQVPFSFKCGGVEFAKLSPQFSFTETEPIIENEVTKLEYTYFDAGSGLELKFSFQIFTQDSAVDFILRVTNRQSHNSPA
ncbi:MAG TPA: hypothetical protein VKK79_10245, partial [Candidatus Lokiarchaeia archaeon]|nr:hypothetical protein [Candidatus Lokiarchaeia archaeon]